MKVPPISIQIRFADVDMMDHVNNAVYLSYFEYARLIYFERLLGEDWDWHTKGLILLRNEIDYIKPLLLNDKPKVEVFVNEIGTKSFSLGYNIWNGEELYTKGISKLVAFNYSQRKSVPIHEEMRSALVGQKEV